MSLFFRYSCRTLVKEEVAWFLIYNFSMLRCRYFPSHRVSCWRIEVHPLWTTALVGWSFGCPGVSLSNGRSPSALIREIKCAL